MTKPQLADAAATMAKAILQVYDAEHSDAFPGHEHLHKDQWEDGGACLMCKLWRAAVGIARDMAAAKKART